MADSLKLGGKVRALRRREELTQGQMAERLGISGSYLNLIENNRRPLTAAILLKIAKEFHADLSSFGSDEDERLTSNLLEAFGDLMFDGLGLTNQDVRDFATGSPNMARAVLMMYRAYLASRDSATSLAQRFTVESDSEGVNSSTLPSEEVSDLIQGAMNHFPELEHAAERIRRHARLGDEDVYRGLVRYLGETLDIRVEVVRVGVEREAMRRYDPEQRVLRISEVLPPRSRRFQLAHQAALLLASDDIDACLKDRQRHRKLSTHSSHALGRVALANYLAAAIIMPYAEFLEAARAERYDIELLAHRFGTSFEQVCHRMTTLRRPKMEGIPFHFLRIDLAGNISKRFSASGIQIARFSGACPRWNVHHAFLTPGLIRIQISRMPNGKVYFCLARTLRSDRGGYHVPHTVQAVGMGCEIRYAKELVYADGIDLNNDGAIVPVGVSCRVCDMENCAQRALPSLTVPLRVRENERGLSFYSPIKGSTPPMPRAAPVQGFRDDGEDADV